MSTTKTYRAALRKDSKKDHCPQCRQKTFVRCVEAETGELLPPHVGRCDRENSCGYSYSWVEYYKEVDQDKKPFIEAKPIEAPKPVDFLPLKYLEATLPTKHYQRNNFYQFIEKRFTDLVAKEVFSKYLIGTSNYWEGAAVFPQIDEAGNLRQIKIMLHNAETGKRVKEGAQVKRFDRRQRVYIPEITEKSCSIIYGRFIEPSFKELNLEQCFFGQHLLAEYPDKKVCIVESEKTAIIASILLPQFVWMATGGASGCKWREFGTYKVLKGRSVTFFPDYGFFNRKTGKTCYAEWCERIARIVEATGNQQIRVSDLLEEKFSGMERTDTDLADIFLNDIDSTGLALTNGYPVVFDFKDFDILNHIHETL
jgi:hypothetical protein